jgi:hypothetical protein
MKVKLQRAVWFSKNASKELKSLRPVFDKLRTVYELYTNTEPSYSCDFAYWHPERSQIGLLAAAAFLAGKTSLQEYGCQKAGRSRQCPSDLFVRTADAVSFELEAKALRGLNLRDPSKSILRDIRGGLRNATRDSREHKDKESYQAALCFVAPWISKASGAGLMKRWGRVIRKLKPVNGRACCDALVSIHSKRPLPGEKDGKPWRLYPGIALLVKETTSKAARRRLERGDTSLRETSAGHFGKRD